MEQNSAQKLKTAFAELDLSLSDEQINNFQTYYETLIEWNKKINLTAITDYEEVLLKHFLDSVAIIKIVDMTNIQTVIDVGTGAGFPGIPLKIVFPHLRITLLDSLQKRVQFLNTIIGQLNLQHVQTIHGRAEDVGQTPQHREQYDLSISRAVANLSTLAEYCTPFIKIGGTFVAYKAENIETEIEEALPALQKLNCELYKTEKFSLPNSALTRSFVQIKRTEQLEKRYPRKAGLPAKKPLR